MVENKYYETEVEKNQRYKKIRGIKTCIMSVFHKDGNLKLVIQLEDSQVILIAMYTSILDGHSYKDAHVIF